MDNERKALLAILYDQTIRYYGAFAHVAGSAIAGLFLSMLVRWAGPQLDGEVFRTQEQIRQDTGLNRYEQDQARRRLKELGLITEQRRGVPCRLYYRIHVEELVKALAALSDNNQVCSPSTNWIVEGQQTIISHENSHEEHVRQPSADVPPPENRNGKSEPSPNDDWDGLAATEHPAERLVAVALGEAEADRPGRPPGPLDAQTEAEHMLFDALDQAAVDAGRRRRRRRFATRQQREKFLKGVERLNGEFGEVVDRLLQEGITDLRRAVDYIAACGRRRVAERRGVKPGGYPPPWVQCQMSEEDYRREFGRAALTEIERWKDLQRRAGIEV